MTRDRKELLCEWTGTWFRLIDTGGVDEADGGPFGTKIAEQARAAIDEADLVLFVVDARAGITPGDEELAVILRAAKRPVIVLANKIDDPRRDSESAVFHRLGLGDPWPLSGLHGHGTGDLLDEIVSRLPGTSEVAIGTEAIRVAILGRPNVGKSSLLNRLVGRERVIVSEVPGHDARRDRHGAAARRDDVRARRHGRPAPTPQAAAGDRVLLASCARCRRPSGPTSRSCCSTRPRGSSSRTSPSPTSPARPGCSTLAVLSKWDVTELEIVEAQGHLARRLRQRPPVIAVSAKTGRGIDRLLDKVEELFAKHNGRITTGELNRALGELKEARPGPQGERGRRLKLMYGTQVSTRPPRFRIFVNAPSLVTRDYGYWVENELRKRFELEGVPVSIDFVKSE